MFYKNTLVLFYVLRRNVLNISHFHFRYVVFTFSYFS